MIAEFVPPPRVKGDNVDLVEVWSHEDFVSDPNHPKMDSLELFLLDQ